MCNAAHATWSATGLVKCKPRLLFAHEPAWHHEVSKVRPAFLVITLWVGSCNGHVSARQPTTTSSMVLRVM
jgi:hypothetical protein